MSIKGYPRSFIWYSKWETGVHPSGKRWALTSLKCMGSPKIQTTTKEETPKNVISRYFDNDKC